MTDGSSMRPARCGLWLLLSLTLSACGLPAGDSATPEGAYYGWLQGRSLGSAESLWPHLAPEVRDALDRWCAAEGETTSLLSTSAFTVAQREAALAELDGGRRASCTDGQSLLGVLVGEGTPTPLSFFVGLGARVQRADVTGGSGTLTTWAGDEVDVERSTDGRWFVTPPGALTGHVREASERAVANLERVREQRNLSVTSGR